MDKKWLLLILAILGSGLSMFAIGILLVHYHEKPIFDWNGLTLNAILAVFSFMSKGMLAYVLSESLGQAKWIWFSSQQRSLNDIDIIDSGSRGPLGSIQILRKPIIRSFISLGAIIVILSITMDFFVQLTVGKKEILKFDNNSMVQISYATRYSKQLKNDRDLGADAPMADMGMQSAVLNGLSQSESWISQQIPHSCSGDCAWDTFTSLAICSGCNDVANRIETIKGTDEYGKSYEYHSLPNNISAFDDLTLMVARGTSNVSQTLSFTSLDALIWSMTMMNFTSADPFINETVSSAIECALWYCINSYKSTVKNGNIIEIIQPAPSKKEINSWRPFRKNEHDSGVMITPQQSGDVLWQKYNDSRLRFTPRRTDLQLEAGFNLSQGAVLSIGFLMRSTFARPRDPWVDSTILVNAYAVKPFRPSVGPVNYDPPAMQSLYESQNLTTTFAKLAQSMTNHIRQNSDNHTVIYGKEGKNVILFRIRGWFMTLPVILIIGSAVFLMIVGRYTHMARMEFWGTNTLPIVALGGKMGTIFDEENMKISVMEQEAKQQRIQYPTFQVRRPDLNRNENILESQEMALSSRISGAQSPSLANTENVMSSTPSLATQRLLLPEVSSIASSSPRIFVLQNPPPDDVESVVSPLRQSVIQSPSSSDAENTVSPIQGSPAEMVSIVSSSTSTSVVLQGPSTEAGGIVSNDA